MPGQLRHQLIDLNDKKSVENLKIVLKEIVSETNYLDLSVAKKYYFKLDQNITINPGWYIILDENKSPLYVGKAQNLNHRLNSENGTRDQFANPQRASDPERNFIKRFHDIDVFKKLYVCIVDEQILCERMDLKFPLSTLDRNNIEKFINIFREFLFTRHI